MLTSRPYGAMGLEIQAEVALVSWLALVFDVMSKELQAPR